MDLDRVELDGLLMVNGRVSCAEGEVTRVIHVRPGIIVKLKRGSEPIVRLHQRVSPPRSPSTFTTQIRLYAFAGHSGRPQEKRTEWFLRWDLPPSQFFPDPPPRFVSSTHPTLVLLQPRLTSPQHLRPPLLLRHSIRIQWRKLRIVHRCPLPLRHLRNGHRPRYN